MLQVTCRRRGRGQDRATCSQPFPGFATLDPKHRAACNRSSARGHLAATCEADPNHGNRIETPWLQPRVFRWPPDADSCSAVLQSWDKRKSRRKASWSSVLLNIVRSSANGAPRFVETHAHRRLGQNAWVTSNLFVVAKSGVKEFAVLNSDHLTLRLDSVSDRCVFPLPFGLFALNSSALNGRSSFRITIPVLPGTRTGLP